MTHIAPIVDLKLLKDGTLASLGSLEIRTWDLNTYLQKNCYTEPSSAPVVLGSISLTLIAGGLGSGRVSVWDSQSGSKFQDIQHAKGKPVSDILLVNSTSLITADPLSGIMIWDITLPTWSGAIYMPNEKASSIIKLNNEFLAYFYSSTVYGFKLYNMYSNTIYTLKTGQPYDSMALINQDTIALAINRYSNSFFSIEIWYLVGGTKMIKKITNNTNSVCSIDSIQYYTCKILFDFFSKITLNTFNIALIWIKIFFCKEKIIIIIKIF